MKRFFTFLLTAAMSLSLTGCGGSSDTLAQQSQKAPRQAEAVSVQEQQGSVEESGKVDEGPTDQPVTEATNNTEILVAYFSCTGTTRQLAEYAADALGADLHEILPEVAYTTADLDYSDDSSRSSLEQNDPAARPAISGGLENMEQYGMVLLAYPIWWGEAPRIVNTFLESYDFSGKTIVPFCTSGSSGIGSSATNLQGFTDGATWLSGSRFGGGASRSDLVSWLDGLGLEIVVE